MKMKKLATDVFAALVAHWITALSVTVVTLGLPLWGRVTDQWSWPVAAAVGVVMLAATLGIFRGAPRGRVYETTAELSLRIHADARQPTATTEFDPS